VVTRSLAARCKRRSKKAPLSGLRIPEIDQDPIAHIFGHKAPPKRFERFLLNPSGTREINSNVANERGSPSGVRLLEAFCYEDDAERAVRAALELVAAVGSLKTHAPLQTRVGIATGLVVVGDLIGSGASQEQAIVGETPNIAARLQAIAEPDSVVIAEGTRKLIGNLFELHDLGAQDLKGIVGPVRAWSALRRASVESRFDALHVGTLTELVGHEEELDLLLRR
jgi:class 3 adenylate cyclase